MFLRTGSGLKNQHLFHDVQYFLYCEGRNTKNSFGRLVTLDMVFWKRVFSMKNVKVKCRSVGNKGKLAIIHRILIKKNIKNAIIAMDRDYDDYLKRIIEHPQVIYTYGYSWESDVLYQLDFQTILPLFMNAMDVEDVELEYKEYMNGIKKDLERLCLLDIKYFSCPKALFNRGKIDILSLCKTHEPRILKSTICSNAKSIRHFESIKDIKQLWTQKNVALTVYGKLVAKVIYNWFVYFSNINESVRKVSYDVMMAASVNSSSLEFINSDGFDYYDINIEKFLVHNE